jgi:hypothetical protein
MMSQIDQIGDANPQRVVGAPAGTSTRLSVHATEGSGNHGRDNPARAGWGRSTPLPFFTEVEDD